MQKATSTVVNHPHDVLLVGCQVDHPYLRNCGFTDQTIHHFKLGYCCQGLMKGRITIPIHNRQGNLICYAGRLVDDTAISDRVPKCIVPETGARGGVMLEFRRSLVVYNAHRFLEPLATLIIVESFDAVWWLTQVGIPNVVALMGASCSEEQATIIASLVRKEGEVVVLPDGNTVGARCAMSVFETVGLERPVRWVKLGRDRQPTDCWDAELREALSSE